MELGVKFLAVMKIASEICLSLEDDCCPSGSVDKSALTVRGCTTINISSAASPTLPSIHVFFGEEGMRSHVYASEHE